MPAEAIHLTALREALASHHLPRRLRIAALRAEEMARLGAILLDLPYFDRYGRQALCYAVGLNLRTSPYGLEFHDRAAVPFTFALLEEARKAQSVDIAVIGLGLASHVSIDRQVHPLINALARHHYEGRPLEVGHREVEKYQSICFHEQYYGQDLMGTQRARRLVDVPVRALLAVSHVASSLARALGPLFETPPSHALLRRMGRGYEQHAKLLGGRIGKRIAPPAAKEVARPKFLVGPWGSFPEILQVAIDQSVDVLDAAWSLFEADNASVDQAGMHLASLLPDGTIDPQGEDVDLNAPFVPVPHQTKTKQPSAEPLGA